MNSKTEHVILQQLFFNCWELSHNHQNYTDVLRALVELGEQIIPCTMNAVRGHSAWEQWQRNYNDPERWFPQRIADDVLLMCFTNELLDNYSFITDTDWNLEVKRHSSKPDGGIGSVVFTYTNLTCEGHRRIGIYAISLMPNFIREIKQHIKYLRTGGNPYEAPCE